jgi:CrcB protein
VTYAAISIGAILGANARYILGGWVADRLGSTFPWGTLAVNLTGALLVGLVLGLAADRTVPWWWRSGVAIGFLGSYTTFSTFSYETITLMRDGSYVAALANAGGSLIVSIAAVFVGLAIARVV